MQALLTLDEAAEILKVSKSKIRHERKTGRLKVVAMGRSVRVTESEIKRYIRASTEKRRELGRAAHASPDCVSSQSKTFSREIVRA